MPLRAEWTVPEWTVPDVLAIHDVTCRHHVVLSESPQPREPQFPPQQKGLEEMRGFQIPGSKLPHDRVPGASVSPSCLRGLLLSLLRGPLVLGIGGGSSVGVGWGPVPPLGPLWLVWSGVGVNCVSH